MKASRGLKGIAFLGAVIVLGCGVLAFTITKALAAGPGFTTIDFPRSVATLAGDINDARQIVGRYTDSAGIVHGFLLSNGSYSSFDVPGSTGFTRALGINSKGQIVGDYIIKNVEHGFLLSEGTFITVDPPGSHGTLAEGINTAGDIVGSYFADSNFTGNGSGHGFLLQGGVFTTIDFPDARLTEAWRINDAGQIVGRYQGGDGKYHVYLLSDGNFTSVPDVPGAEQTAPFEIGGFNGNGDIAATYCGSTPCQFGGGFLSTSGNYHGFLLSGGAYTTVDFPSAALTTAFGLDSFDDIVGAYIDSGGRIHGYLRTP